MGTAQPPPSGVKVYVVVVVGSKAGDQVPVTPLFDVVGRIGTQLKYESQPVDSPFLSNSHSNVTHEPDEVKEPITSLLA